MLIFFRHVNMLIRYAGVDLSCKISILDLEINELIADVPLRDKVYGNWGIGFLAISSLDVHQLVPKLKFCQLNRTFRVE